MSSLGIKLMCYTDKCESIDLFEHSANTGIELRDLPGLESCAKHAPYEITKRGFKGVMSDLAACTCWHLSPTLPLYDSDEKFLGLVQYTPKGLRFFDQSDFEFWTVSKACCYLEMKNSLFVIAGTALENGSTLDSVYVSDLDKPLLAIPLIAEGDKLSGMSFYNGLTNSVITYCFQDVVQLSSRDIADMLDAFSHSFNYIPGSPARVLLGNARFNPYEKLGLQAELMAWKLSHGDDSEESYSSIFIDEPCSCYNFIAPPFARRNLHISQRTGTSKLGIHGLTSASAVEVNMLGSDKHELVCYDDSLGSVSVVCPDLSKGIENLDFKSTRSAYLSFSDVNKSRFRVGTAQSITFRKCSDISVAVKSAERMTITSVRNIKMAVTKDVAFLDMQSLSGRLTLDTATLVSLQTCTTLVCRARYIDRLFLLSDDNESVSLDITSANVLMLSTVKQLSLNVQDCNSLMLNRSIVPCQYPDGSIIRGTIHNVKQFGFVLPPYNVSGALMIRGFALDKTGAVSFNFSSATTSSCSPSKYASIIMHEDLKYLLSDKHLRVTLDLTDVESSDFTFRFMINDEIHTVDTQSRGFTAFRLLVLLSTFRLKVNPGTKIRFAFGRAEDFSKLRRVDNLRIWVSRGLGEISTGSFVLLSGISSNEFSETVESHVQSIIAMLKNAGVYEFWVPAV